jgi:integrase
MPQHSKGIRLWLRPARGNERATFVIRDGAKQVRTGCTQSELVAAQRVLADYVARQYQPDRSSRAPSQVRIADVLNIYAQDVAPTHARPYETAHRLAALAKYWGDRPLSAVNGKTCREYVQYAGSPAAARRHLEDFRAAIIHHRREGFCSEVIEVVLPEKSPPRERWLTRAEAARLLWACWRGGQGRRKHVARFILVALFTGTRASAICGAAMEPTQNRGHVDLDQGVFYRRAPAQSRRTSANRPSDCRLGSWLICAAGNA